MGYAAAAWSTSLALQLFGETGCGPCRGQCRHCHVIGMLHQVVKEFGFLGFGRDRFAIDHCQGFVTSLERFVTREQAATIARAAGQTVTAGDECFSEDLW